MKWFAQPAEAELPAWAAKTAEYSAVGRRETPLLTPLAEQRTTPHATAATVRPIAPPDADTATVLWLARQIVRQHTEQPATVEAADPATGHQSRYPTHAAGRCAQCQPDGTCRMLGWARAELGAQRPLDAG